jgi:casein kinase II subunit beta
MSAFQQYDVDNDSESSEQQPWIDWYCTLKGNEFFVRVEESFIVDSFNLTGLDSQFRYYNWALDTILDQTQRDKIPQDQLETVEEEAEQLFGLIHSRYVITQRGLEAVAQKYKRHHLGRCPRVLCNGQATLPVGLTPMLGLESVRLYCPRCDDIYASKSSRHIHIDGAFFGPTLPHLFLLAFPEHKPEPLNARYVPRVFGFRLHQHAYTQSYKYKLVAERIESKTTMLQTQLKQLTLSQGNTSADTVKQVIQDQTEEYKKLTALYLNLHQDTLELHSETLHHTPSTHHTNQMSIDYPSSSSEAEEEDEDDEEEVK